MKLRRQLNEGSGGISLTRAGIKPGQPNMIELDIVGYTNTVHFDNSAYNYARFIVFNVLF